MGELILSGLMWKQKPVGASLWCLLQPQYIFVKFRVSKSPGDVPVWMLFVEFKYLLNKWTASLTWNRLGVTSTVLLVEWYALCLRRQPQFFSLMLQQPLHGRCPHRTLLFTFCCNNIHMVIHCVCRMMWKPWLRKSLHLLFTYNDKYICVQVLPVFVFCLPC